MDGAEQAVIRHALDFDAEHAIGDYDGKLPVDGFIEAAFGGDIEVTQDNIVVDQDVEHALSSDGILHVRKL